MSTPQLPDELWTVILRIARRAHFAARCTHLEDQLGPIVARTNSGVYSRENNINTTVQNGDHMWTTLREYGYGLSLYFWRGEMMRTDLWEAE